MSIDYTKVLEIINGAPDPAAALEAFVDQEIESERGNVAAQSRRGVLRPIAIPPDLQAEVDRLYPLHGRGFVARGPGGVSRLAREIWLAHPEWTSDAIWEAVDRRSKERQAARARGAT